MSCDGILSTPQIHNHLGKAASFTFVTSLALSCTKNLQFSAYVGFPGLGIGGSQDVDRLWMCSWSWIAATLEYLREFFFPNPLAHCVSFERASSTVGERGVVVGDNRSLCLILIWLAGAVFFLQTSSRIPISSMDALWLSKRLIVYRQDRFRQRLLEASIAKNPAEDSN